MTASKAKNKTPFSFSGETLRPGKRGRAEIPIARIPSTQIHVTIPIEIIHGKYEGPCLWLSGAIHGDELNGIEIIRQILEKISPSILHGTIIAAPAVNVFGVMNQSRYLPDRRDLNRSFPGSKKGSLASIIAHAFMKEVVARSDYGIDFHTGSNGRTNLPQIRCDTKDPETLSLAKAFNPPLILHSKTRKGTLREAALKKGVKTLVFEGGEPLRFSRRAVKAGYEGTLRALGHLGMIRRGFHKSNDVPQIANKTAWVRAAASGLCRILVREGDQVTKGQRLGIISDSFGDTNKTVVAPSDGLVVGMTRAALLHKGDAMVHITSKKESAK